jgi:histidinol dehydrogenase
LNITRLSTQSVTFNKDFENLLAWDQVATPELMETVLSIIKAVKVQGDEALLEYTRRFDRYDCQSMNELMISREELEASRQTIFPELDNALTLAAKRIKAYHERQPIQSWEYTDGAGARLGQKVTPLDRVGLYVPGGKAAYPSSVLMNAIPAKVAGVDELVMVVPAPDGNLNPLVMAAAAIAGVDKVFTIGGAQAIAALAYGTQSVPNVDKIVGPGNSYVALAKSLVFGQVGIDMIAGPSEICIVCDGGTPPDWVAMDLFSQAEHDEAAQAILLCPDEAYIDQVQESMDKLLPEMPRAEIIRAALENRGALIQVSSLNEAVSLVNRIAPEHLELSVENASALEPNVRHAGAIFMGRYTAESFGDYCAGPNHVLPTSGTARFSSPLGVYDFQKRSSIIELSSESAQQLGDVASTLAYGEGLQAHARSAEFRSKRKGL